MTRKVRRSSGGVHDLGLHVVRCPEYRRPVLGGRVAERLDELIRQKAAERGWEIIALEVMPDHVHLFVLIVETRFSDVRPDTVYRRLSLKGTGHRALRHPAHLR